MFGIDSFRFACWLSTAGGQTSYFLPLYHGMSTITDPDYPIWLLHALPGSQFRFPGLDGKHIYPTGHLRTPVAFMRKLTVVVAHPGS